MFHFLGALPFLLFLKILQFRFIFVANCQIVRWADTSQDMAAISSTALHSMSGRRSQSGRKWTKWPGTPWIATANWPVGFAVQLHLISETVAPQLFSVLPDEPNAISTDPFSCRDRVLSGSVENSRGKWKC